MMLETDDRAATMPVIDRIVEEVNEAGVAVKLCFSWASSILSAWGAGKVLG